MGRQGGQGAAADAVVNGVLTGGWYALPDVVASRRARGSLKVAVIVGGAAWAARAVRAAQAADGDTVDAAAEGGGDAPAAEAVPTTLVARMATEPAIDAQALGLGGTPPNGVGPVRMAAGVALVVLSVLGTVAGERAIYRWGERLTARGVRYAHTRIGLAAGGVMGLSTCGTMTNLYAIGNAAGNVFGGVYPGPGATIGQGITLGHAAVDDILANA